jgi:hypothetical protein
MKKIIIPIMVILITAFVAVWGMYNFIKNFEDMNSLETVNTPENIQSDYEGCLKYSQRLM